MLNHLILFLSIEYMSILFVIWNDNIGRGILESKGLFPNELKNAMQVNRNEHAPTG